MADPDPMRTAMDPADQRTSASMPAGRIRPKCRRQMRLRTTKPRSLVAPFTCLRRRVPAPAAMQRSPPAASRGRRLSRNLTAAPVRGAAPQGRIQMRSRGRTVTCAGRCVADVTRETGWMHRPCLRSPAPIRAGANSTWQTDGCVTLPVAVTPTPHLQDCAKAIRGGFCKTANGRFNDTNEAKPSGSLCWTHWTNTQLQTTERLTP